MNQAMALLLTDKQNNLLFPIQGELDINVPKRGNPNWVNKYKSGKTTPIRVPIAYQDQVKQFIKQLDNPDQLEIVSTPLAPLTPQGVKDVSIASLTIAPEIFQYKVIHSSTGKTGSLKGVKVWDQNLAGLVLVWYQQSSNTTFVVNGHNRVDLAKSLGVESITVRFLECETAKDARIIGALANLSEGRGNAIDCAKFLRDSGLGINDLKSKGIPLGERIVNDGVALANLAPHIWDKTFRGDLDQDTAVAIGSALTDHDLQTSLLKLIDRDRRKLSKEVIKELADTIQCEEMTETQELTLFGIEYTNQSLAIERSQIQALVKSRLSREKRLFGSVSKARTIETLAKAGNKIEQLASKELSEKSESALIYFDQFKLLSGELSKFISRLAKEFSNKKISLEAAADQVIGYLDQSTNHWQGLSLG